MPEQKSTLSFWSKIKNSKNTSLFLGVGFLVLIVLVAVGIALNSKNKDEGSTSDSSVVFTIEGKKYYKDQMLALARYQTEIRGVTEDDALSLVYDLEKEIAASQKAGINPSQDEINAEKPSLITPDLKKLKDFDTKYQPWFEELAKLNAAKRYVGGEFGPTQKGYVVLFYYNTENESYAKSRADYYQQQVSSGQISADKAVKAIASDEKIAPPKSFISHFGIDPIKTWDEEITQQGIKSYIKSLSSKGVTAVQSGSNESGLPESFYYFVSLDELPTSKVVSLDEYNNSLKNLNASYNGFTLSSTNNGEEQK